MANILYAGVITPSSIDTYIGSVFGTVTLDSTVITSISNVSLCVPDSTISNSNIAPDTTIVSVDGSDQITISKPATGTEINATLGLNCPTDGFYVTSGLVKDANGLFSSYDVVAGWLIYCLSTGFSGRILRFKIVKITNLSGPYIDFVMVYDAPGGLIGPYYDDYISIDTWAICQPTTNLQLGTYIDWTLYTSLPFDGFLIQEEENRRILDLLNITGIQGITGLQGLQGITGIMGIDGVTGIMGTDGVTGLQGIQGVTGYGIQGVTGIGAGATSIQYATELPLGNPPGGFSQGIFPWDASTMSNPAFDQINSLLYAIAPSPPGSLSGDLILAGTTKYTAILPTNLDSSSWYRDGSVAGSAISDYIVSNSYTLSNANPSTTFKVGSTFGGDIGTVWHVLDGTNYNYRDVTQGVGTSGTIQITDVTTYNSIWRKGNARISYTQTSEGYRRHQICYTAPSINQITNNIKFWYDNVNGTPGFPQDSTITQNSLTSTRYLSGIRYYYIGDTFDMSSLITNIAKKGIHPTSPIVYSMPGLIPVTTTISGASFPYDGTYNFQITDALDLVNVYNIDARLKIDSTKPNGLSASKITVTQNRLVNTYPINYSTNCNVYMYDEYYRWKATDDFSVIPSNYSNPIGDWTSSDLLINGNGQLYNGTWYYPRINYTSGYLPTQTANYSVFSGDQTIVWACNIGNAHSSMTINFIGLSSYTDIAPEGTSGTKYLNVVIRLPSVIPSFAPTGWMDCGKSFGNGNGCRNDSGSSGTTVACTFGTSSSTGSNGVVFIKVVLKSSSVSTASRIVATGT